MLQALNHKQVEGYLQRAFGQQLQVRLKPASCTVQMLSMCITQVHTALATCMFALPSAAPACFLVRFK